MSDNEQHPLDLRDPRQAGVYRVMRADVVPLMALAQDEFVAIHDIDLHGIDDKPALLVRIGEALQFPAGWGGNWDALADALNDLSWLGEPTPRLLVWRGMDQLHARAPELESTLCDILEEASARWAADGVAMWSLLSLAHIPDEDQDEDDASSG